MHMADSRRRDLIARHLRTNPAQSQASLAHFLGDHGIETTQATISRDLAAMGVLKGPHGYVLPDDASMSGESVPNASLSVIQSHVLTAVAADSIVVIHTAPGHADVVAVELDRWPPSGVAGCIAGDDTLFLATTSKATAQKVAAKIGAMLAQKG
jgi:transcriptional regulator of arginine metabolism